MSQTVKPGYKQTEVGVIPEEWESVKAGDIGRFRGGNGFPLRFQGETASGYPFYKVSDMNNEGNDTFMFDSNNWISEGIRKQLGATAFPTDTIIFAKVGAAVFLERKKILTKPSCIDNNLCGLVLDKSRTHVRFVHYSLLNIKFGSLVSTTALPSLSGAVLSQIAFALPPLPEQRAIATALSDVDALLAALDRLIAKQRDLKQAAMQQLLTGQTRLPGFTGKWETKRLEEVGTFFKGSGVKKDESQSGPLPCIRYGEIYTRHNDYIKEFNSFISTRVATTACLLKKGDLLFAGSGETKEEIGKCVAFVDDFEAYAGGDIVILRPQGVDSLFLGYSLNTPSINRQKASRGQGDAVVHIGSSALASISLSLPPLPEQTAIATVLSDMDLELAALEQRRDKTRALKQGMMQELLTGRTRLA